MYKDEEVLYRGKKLKYTYYTGGIDRELDLSGFNGKEVIEEIKKLEAEGIPLEAMYCTSTSRYGDELAVMKYVTNISEKELQERRRTALERVKRNYDQILIDAKKVLREAGECDVS